MPQLFGSDNPSYKHGMRDSSEYGIWCAMLGRCRNPKATGYKNWGGRGITVCERWEIFANFFADMGKRPKGMSLDRFPNNDGNYEPGNCRWATRTEQNRNSRHNVYIEHGGQRKLISEWAREFGLRLPTLIVRHQRGWQPPALFRPPKFGVKP